MTVSLEEMLAEESEESRARIRLLAEEMRAEMNLREVRRLRKLTQSRLSKKLKIGQEGVSRIEKRSDLYLSTLRSYVEGVGGKLTLMVQFPDRPPVILTGLGENADASKNRAKKKAGTNPKSKPRMPSPGLWKHAINTSKIRTYLLGFALLKPALKR
jgi:DNA-binding XRE family transcriptional regulator